jgi:predicted amidohydrolase YtcJ
MDGLGDDMLALSGVMMSVADFIFGDGGWTWERYQGETEGTRKHGPYGYKWWLDDEQSDRVNMVLATKYGWSILGTHTAGDRAASAHLDAYAEGKADPVYKNSRQVLSIDHGPMLTERYGHLTKMKELGVIPSIAMKYLFVDAKRGINAHGADRVNEMTPFRSLIDAGLKPVFEADLGGAPYFHPLWQMEKALTRVDENGYVVGAKEKVSRQEALWMYTNWARYYTGDDDRLGIIEPGRLADLVVLDGDFMTVPADQISEIPVDMTFVGGNVIYDSEVDGDFANQSVEEIAQFLAR